MGQHDDNLKSISTLLGFLFLVSQGCSALKCLQCISIECGEGESQLFCEGVKEYVISRLPDLYYGYASQKVPLCPSPNDNDTGWVDLQRQVNYECEAEKADDATCVLGRFRVTTEIYETGKNITSFGTSMGCAKPALLKMTRDAMKKGECDMSSSRSNFKHSLRHYLEVEHCARPPEMCHKTDFCIPPHASRIKIFSEKPKEKQFPFTLVLGLFFILAMAVIVLTFLAPFFNG